MSKLFLLFTMTTTTTAVQHIASTMNDNQGVGNLCLNSDATSRGERSHCFKNAMHYTHMCYFYTVLYKRYFFFK